MIAYATLARVKAQLRVVTEDDTTDEDALLMQYIYQYSRNWEHETGQHYAPLIKTVYLNARSGSVGERGTVLRLGEGLLSVTTVTNGDGTALTAYDPSNGTGAYILENQGRYDSQLRLVDGSVWTGSAASVYRAITITGVWGIHHDYSSAWIVTGDTVQDNPLSSGTTTLTVTNTERANELGLRPRISDGNLLRIETEYVEVIQVRPVLTVTIRRAARGSSAAAHNQNVPIYAWQPHEDAQRYVELCAAYAYSRRGDFAQSTIAEGLGTVRWPKDRPEEARALLANHQQRVFVRGMS